MAHYQLPTLQAVDKAARLLNHKVLRTPIVTSNRLSRLATSNSHGLDVELIFKCENYQHTGSFKFRGASHFLAQLNDYELSKGVVAYSTGKFEFRFKEEVYLTIHRESCPRSGTGKPNCVSRAEHYNSDPRNCSSQLLVDQSSCC